MVTDSSQIYIPWEPVLSWDGGQTRPLPVRCWRSVYETVTPAWLVSWIQSPPEKLKHFFKRRESVFSTIHLQCLKAPKGVPFRYNAQGNQTFNFKNYTQNLSDYWSVVVVCRHYYLLPTISNIISISKQQENPKIFLKPNNAMPLLWQQIRFLSISRAPL